MFIQMIDAQLDELVGQISQRIIITGILIKGKYQNSQTVTMKRVEFIKKIHPFSNTLRKTYLEQQQLLQPQPLIRLKDHNDDYINIRQQEKMAQAEQNILKVSDTSQEARQIQIFSQLFEKREPRNANKLAKIFKRRKQQQFMELNAIKQAIIRQFGEVGQQFNWIVKEESMSVNGPKFSRKLTQNKDYFLKNIEGKDSVQFTLSQQDYKRLLPGVDLNDALIDSYFKIMKTFILPQETNKMSYVFSTYLLHKLTSEIQQLTLSGQVLYTSEQCIQLTRQEVRKKYDKVLRWNRKIDIFDKKILVFPINMLGHWFCAIVLNPGSLILQDQKVGNKCTIVFCDSMFEQRFFVVEAIREYLSLQLQFKTNLKIKVTQQNAHSFQFLLPRQTNQHDCGLYMLAYIEELLLNHKQHFSDLHDIQKWNKLRYFPRRYMYSLRQRIMKLLVELYQKQVSLDKISEVLQTYIKEKQKIYEQAQKTEDYDVIDEQEFQKYLILMQLQDNREDQLYQYRYLVKFSLSPEVNYVQKDIVEEQYEFSSEEDSDYM